MKETTDIRRRKGIYLLPNLLTTAGIFAGFYAIVAAMKGQFDNAAIAIFVAMIADGLDGRVARFTNTQSAFGVEYDSLADMVSFAIAPALVVYQWALLDLGKAGWLAAFMYTASVALRLARFNTQVGHADRRYFRGLACPAAAGVVAGLVWFGHEYHVARLSFHYLVWILTVSLAVLMVSNIRYYSFKELDLKGRVPFVAMLAIILVLVTVALDPPQVLFYIFFGYMLSGPVLTLWKWRQAVSVRHRRKQQRKARRKAADGES